MAQSPSKPPQRRLAAILSCDISGYSRVMGLDEEQAVKLVERHFQLTESALERFGGRLIKRMGDGVLIEFPSAVTAVECAMAMQQRLASYNEKASEQERFMVRIGVHLGEIVESGADVLGDGINIAMRIETLADPGGICISQDVFQQLQNQSRFETASLGSQDLKNIPRPIEVHRVVTGNEEAVRRVAGSYGDWFAAGPRRWVLIAGAAVLALLVLLWLNEQRLKGRDGRLATDAADSARLLIENRKADEAVAVLQQAKGRLRAKAPQHEALDQLLDKASQEQAKQQVSDRYMSFLGHLVSQEYGECLDFLPPDNPLRDKPQLAELWFKVIAGVATKLNVKQDDVRLTNCQLGAERKTATIYAEVRFGKAWHPFKPSQWQLIEGNWYVLEKPRPGQNTGMRKIAPKTKRGLPKK